MFQKAVIITFTVYALCAGMALADDPDAYSISKIKAARKCTVLINGDKVNQSTLIGSKDSAISYNGVGAGVIVDPRGYVITNYHVIEGIQKLQVRTYEGQEYIGHYISHDPTKDIALIKISPVDTLTPITIGDSSSIDILDRIVVTGHPFGYDYSTNSGEISGLCRELPVKDNLKYFNMIQISAAVNPGNSGGPLLNTNGEMIGVISALRQDANQIAFAIPVDFVMEVGADLFNQHTSQHCYHGIRFKDIDVNLIGTPNVDIDDYKVLTIESIDSGSPAEEAELRPGDILCSFDDLTLERKLDFQRALIDKKENDAIKVVFKRDGAQYETDLILGSPKSRGGRRTYVATATPDAAIREYVWNTFGLRVSPISQNELNRLFPESKRKNIRYKLDGAVLVDDVRPGSVFDLVKIQKGDMLAGMLPNSKEGWNIMRANDLKFLAERWTPEEMGGNEVTILVIRDQKLLTGTLPVNQNDIANSGPSGQTRR